MRLPTGPRNAADAADWLVLIRSENVGPATFYSLMERFGSAAAAIEALPSLPTERRPIVAAKRSSVAREMERAEKAGITYLFFGDPDYPERLAAIHAPPPVITVRGDLTALSRDPLAIVGARKASAGGRTLARRFAEGFGEVRRTVVSGLARGIDEAAHKAALLPGTVAVVAGGVDRPTPEEHAPLAEEIVAAGGAVTSEMPLGYMPFARDYPRRNRLIAGLSDAVVVIEAAARSGSLHTARYASDESREVYAVPGSPLDPRVEGCLQLLKSGAAMATHPRDVLQHVQVLAASRPEQKGAPGAVSEEEPPAFEILDVVDRVASLLSPSPVPLDVLVREAALPPHTVLAALTELEISGRAERDVDGGVRAVV
ncbi:MAG: DNA-processing protein DprA [Pseudomonadota bacterium]